MILDPDELPVREHYRQCGKVIPPCCWCGKQVQRGVLWQQFNLLVLHLDCARLLVEGLQVDLERLKRLPEILVPLVDPRVKLPEERVA
jgi:hypothetical protein